MKECRIHEVYPHPMPVYRQAHTTGKALFGGRHDGFFRSGYQVFTSLRVMKLPRKPPTCGRAVIPSMDSCMFLGKSTAQSIRQSRTGKTQELEYWDFSSNVL